MSAYLYYEENWKTGNYERGSKADKKLREPIYVWLDSWEMSSIFFSSDFIYRLTIEEYHAVMVAERILEKELTDTDVPRLEKLRKIAQYWLH